jgi:ATP-dependent Clp protease protease subunit
MRQIFLFSIIDSYSAQAIIQQLLSLDRENNDEITMFINSPGGSVYQMFAIIDTMNMIKSPVRTVVVGIAASAAACLASAGKVRLMSPTAQIMIHEASAGTFGSISEMQESLEQLAKQNEIMVGMIAKNTKQPLSVIKEAINKKDKYFSAQEAVTFGLVDKVVAEQEAQVLKFSEGINVEGFELSLDNKEVQLLREGNYQHPIFGRTSITENVLDALKKNFDAQVRGQEISIDYTHENEDGEKPAAFWIKSLEIRQNSDGKGKGLFARGEFTPKGAKLVSEKEYRYSSADFVIDYTDQNGKHHPYVLRGGTLTNRPFIKNMNPIKLSEHQPFKKETPKMNKEALIAALMAHGIDVTSLQASGEALQDRVRELEAKIVELNALPAKKEEEVTALKNKLAEINAKIINSEKENTFNALVKEGKVVPAQKEQIMAAFKTHEEIAAFYKNAPVVVALKAAGSAEEVVGDLSAEEQTLVNMGLYTAEQIIANRTSVKK